MLDLKCCGEAPGVSTALASVLGESERPSHASNRQQRKCKRYSCCGKCLHAVHFAMKCKCLRTMKHVQLNDCTLSGRTSPTLSAIPHSCVFNRETFCSAVKIIDFFSSESCGGNLGCPANQN